MSSDEIEMVGHGFFFEELPLGRRFRTLGRTLYEADLMAFVHCTGFGEVLFTNSEFVKAESDIKGRLVPAAMIYSFIEGLVLNYTGQHTGFAFLNAQIDVHGPTFVGDTIHAVCEVTESRRSKSKPDRGIVRTKNEVFNQDGKLVLTYTPARWMKARTTG
ncbi:MAG TPA: acyl dehydratase [Sphingobium sp.]